jgi:hypothetical protein
LEPRTRSLWSIGRRVERLLVAGTVLVALSLLAFYLAFAARHYAEDRISQGMESLALLIEGDDKVLQRFYELESQRQKLASKKKEPVTENFYAKALEDKIARASTLSGADAQSLRGLVSEKQPPAELVKALRERKKELDERPATVAGVIVPSSSLGTRLPAAFVANMFIVTLAPLIILWLAALRITRAREKAAMDGASEPYPHALNAEDLPLEALVVRHAGSRWDALPSAQLKAALLAFLRMAVLALLVVPLIAAYIATVTTLGMGTDGAWLRALYAVVVFAVMLVQAAGLLLAEVPAAPGKPFEDELETREEPRMTNED